VFADPARVLHEAAAEVVECADSVELVRLGATFSPFSTAAARLARNTGFVRPGEQPCCAGPPAADTDHSQDSAMRR
jgi:hypothetical protein